MDADPFLVGTGCLGQFISRWPSQLQFQNSTPHGADVSVPSAQLNNRHGGEGQGRGLPLDPEESPLAAIKSCSAILFIDLMSCCIAAVEVG